MSIKEYFKRYWLFGLIVMQPLLDLVAYFSQSESGTISGYIRLAIMLVLPTYLLITLRKKWNFIISMGVIGLLCLLHFANSYRLGYISMTFDVGYYVRIAQMPVLAICFINLDRSECEKRQMFIGMTAAAALSLAFLLIAILTGTYNTTYGPGLGISGWVLNDNRCANSCLLVVFAVFAMWAALKSKNKIINAATPVIICAVFLLNGTKACYFSLFALMLGYAFYLILHGILNKEKIRAGIVILLVILCVAAVAVYPYTPRYRVEQLQNTGANENQELLIKKIADLGYDVTTMSFEEKYNNPQVYEVFAWYYNKLMHYVMPAIFDRFGVDRIMVEYNMTYEAKVLIDYRLLKATYAKMLWEDQDILTKLVGFEVSLQCGEGMYDLENDWPALFYYCGYLGFGVYVLFVLWFVWLIIKKVFSDFKGSFDLDNFTLLMGFALMTGLAQFSGAVLRRPNVSIFYGLILGMIYYQTVTASKGIKEVEK